MSEQIIIDIKALSTEANAMIVSVALVLVDTSQAIGSPKSIKAQAVFLPSMADQTRLCCDVSSYINGWWNMQSDEARKVFYLCKRIPFSACLEEIYYWLNKYDYPIWSKSENFISAEDFGHAMLKNAFRKAALFWPDHRVRCLRSLLETTKDLYPHMRQPSFSALNFKGIKNMALDDALHGAKELAFCLSYLKGVGR